MCSYKIYRTVEDLKVAVLSRRGISEADFECEERAWDALLEALYEECDDDES